MPYHVGKSWEEHRAIAQWLRDRGEVYGNEEDKGVRLQRAADLLLQELFLDGSDNFVSMGRRRYVAKELEEIVESGWYERGPNTEAMKEAIRELTDITVPGRRTDGLSRRG